MSGVIVLCVSLFISGAIQFLLVAGFIARLRRPANKLIDDAEAPKATVILCLRGGDPFLKRCLHGLMNQDYPNYRVTMVVDSEADPSRRILDEVFAESPLANFEVIYLGHPLETCSLKCSSLIAALKPKVDSDGFVAFVDADTIPHRSWLRELATGLQPSNVGAATGNRWYIPEQPSLGSMIRHVWNGAAIVQMFWYDIAWGGTLAIKWDTIRKANLLDRWSHALCEDTMLCRELKSISQRIAFVPACMMINREVCTLESFLPWVKRQLLTARLYHPKWFAVVGHGVTSAGLLLWGWLGFLCCICLGEWALASMYAIAMATYHGLLTVMLPWIESAVLAIAEKRGEIARWSRPVGWLRFAGFVWLTQWLYTWALLGCLGMKSVSWRGIQYEVQSGSRIRMLGYTPYEAVFDPTDNTKQSL
jgi:cellulose synthase/poly-beta-1,6-N-acetylglucosamine synthase-like glycosyltransferase